MRSTRIAISAAMLGALALPVLSATTASAAPIATAAAASNCPTLPPLPHEGHTKAVTIRSKATTKSTTGRSALPQPQVHRAQDERQLALHHGPEHRRPETGLRHVRLPRRPHVSGLTGAQSPVH